MREVVKGWSAQGKNRLMCLELLKHQERSNIVNFLLITIQEHFHRLENTKQGKDDVFRI